MLFCEELIIFGQSYKPNYMLRIKNNEKNKLGRICLILFFEGSYYFVFKNYDSIYDEHLNAFEIKETPIYEIILAKQEYFDYRPSNIYKNFKQNDNRLFIKQDFFV